MHRIALKAYVPDVTALPSLVAALSAELRRAECMIVARPSWVVADCRGTLVKASLYAHLPLAARPSIELEGSLAVEVEGERGEEVVRLTEIVTEALERAGAGVTLHG